MIMRRGSEAEARWSRREGVTEASTLQLECRTLLNEGHLIGAHGAPQDMG